ncbi:IS66 family transposase zinc-finger binding domain-containing protein [Candidatus Aeolococcus gillhamiae]|uniref:IS66 family transposase zinc-finger binding domain-containing protein n=1 Tax=Candidatus Aeolococcus gillhamiae TaxID=3127015 RepID=UPI00331302A2
MGSPTDLLPEVVCPHCGSDRLVPLTFESAEVLTGTHQVTRHNRPAFKCLTCATRFNSSK